MHTADLQIGLFCGPANSAMLEDAMGIDCEDYIPACDLTNDREGFTFCPTLLHPKVRLFYVPLHFVRILLTIGMLPLTSYSIYRYISCESC